MMSPLYGRYRISQESLLLIESYDEYENDDDQDNDTEKDRRQ